MHHVLLFAGIDTKFNHAEMRYEAIWNLIVHRSKSMRGKHKDYYSPNWAPQTPGY